MNFRKCMAVTTILTPLLLTAACKDKTDQEAVVPSPAEVVLTLDTTEEKLSYLMGYSSALQAKEAGLTLSTDALTRAVEDVQAGKDSLISDDEMRRVGSEFQRLVQENRLSSAREENVKAGKNYLDENRKRPEVIETSSGLQYEVLVSGKDGGVKPTPQDTVKVHYHGTLVDGKVFDSSVEKGGEPVSFGVTQVIPGWTEILQLMTEGDKWKVVIPSHLAYPNGTRNIQPGSTLIFEIELIEVIAQS